MNSINFFESTENISATEWNVQNVRGKNLRSYVVVM